MATSSNGSLTERYQIKKHLGSGGNGDAYLAFDTSLRREIVIKRVRTGENDEKLSQEIMEEAARMAALKHPNIVSIYDISLIERTPCIVMEFVQGKTLDEWVHANGAFDTEAFVELARQTLDALACAHQTNLVHRDIKPSNIMLVDLPSGLFQAKVLDFGLAKFLNTDAPSPQTVNIDGSIKGSVHFISPEQLNHEAVDARSDLYSLGCSLYLALTSIEPFAGESVAGIIAAHLTHRVIPAGEVLNTVPPAINEWLMKMMSRKTVDRFQTALEAMQALEIAAQKSGVSSATRAIRVDRRSATVNTTPSKPKGLLWTVAAAAAVVCTGLAAAFLFSGKKTEEPASTRAASTTAAEAPAAPAPSPSPSPSPETITAAATPSAPVEKAATPAPTPISTAAIPPASIEKAPEKAEVIMQVVGSNTIGAKLMPKLIEAFLERMKMTGLDTEEIKAEESEIRFVSPLGDGRKAVAVKAHGSSTAFKELLAGSCDIGMASRPIKDEEIQNLAGLGDMRSSGCEHVVGLDGLAVIVNKANPISQLTVQQVAALFSGEIRDWSEIGGAPGPVTLYARDDKSGTFDSFKSLVLDKKTLNAEARRFEDSNALSDGVAADPSGIGFIGLPYVRATKALALSDAGTAPMLPSPFTVATEDYILSRRLYLYTPAVPKNAWTTNFVEFVLSDEGQDIVEKSGFIPQRINLETMTASQDMAESYRSLIEQGAGRLSLTFRFQPKQKELDAKAVRDFDRVMRYLAKPENRQKKIYLLGFSDSIGEASTNLKLARERTDVVARQLTMRGIAVASTIALGEEMPVATNDTEAGREKNRRVEIWIQGAAGITKL